MRVGLPSIPSQSDFEKAYDKLLHSHSVPIDRFVRYVPWCRFDPRFAEICVQYLTRKWNSLNPLKLRELLEKQPWPAVFGVLLEFTKKKETSEVFRYWSKLVTFDLKPASDEQFFMGFRQLGGLAMLEDSAYSLSEYRRWGYLSRENLLGKETTGTLPPQTRHEILKSLFSRTQRVKTNDYWLAIGKCVSKRQAERDLKDSPLLSSHGRTKGKLFTFRKLRQS